MLTLEHDENIHEVFSKDMRELIRKTPISMHVAIQSRMLSLELLAQ